MEPSSPPQGRVSQTRDWKKCSVCRGRKKKCKPQDRDWENQGQRCEYCLSKDLECGPNIRNSEDPAVRSPGAAEEAGGAWSASTGAPRLQDRASTAEASSAAGVIGTPDYENSYQLSQPDTSQEQSDEEDFRGSFADDESRRRAQKSLNDLHALCRAFAPRVSSASCRGLDPQETFSAMKIKVETHRIFIHIYRTIIRLYELGKHDQALVVLYGLNSAMGKYPWLWDAEKYGPLLNMAQIFEKLGHHFEYTNMLEMMTTSPHSSIRSPRQELAWSFIQTFQIIKGVLARYWRTMTGENNIPDHLQLPCLHQAAQCKDGGVVSAILTIQHRPASHPGVYNLQRVCVARLLDEMQISEDHIKFVSDIDGRDACGQTALFVAAASGSYKACFELLLALADPNARDSHGHTILEIAAGQGHLEIVKILLKVGAELNPQILPSTYTPLQANVGSNDCTVELVKYLLEQGADYNVRQSATGQNAVEIAQGKGRLDIVSLIHRQQTPNNS